MQFTCILAVVNGTCQHNDTESFIYRCFIASQRILVRYKYAQTIWSDSEIKGIANLYILTISSYTIYLYYKTYLFMYLNIGYKEK